MAHTLENSDRGLILENGRLTHEGDAKEMLKQTELGEFYFGN